MQLNGHGAANVGAPNTDTQGHQTIQFETPRMPVVFVLGKLLPFSIEMTKLIVFLSGGPGSGKITHSETLVRHRKGYVHINMTEKLQKLLEGTGKEIISNQQSFLPGKVIRENKNRTYIRSFVTELHDIGSIPTSQVTHVVMAALQRQPNVYGYIVSGYPRNLRDVAIYSEKVCL